MFEINQWNNSNEKDKEVQLLRNKGGGVVERKKEKEENDIKYKHLILGAGDALWGGVDYNTLFVGVGPRTDVRSLWHLRQSFGDKNWKAIGCRLIDPR